MRILLTYLFLVSYLFSQEFIKTSGDHDDYFVIPNSFEAISLNVVLGETIKLDLGYVSKMSGPQDALYDGSNFHSMSRQAE